MMLNDVFDLTITYEPDLVNKDLENSNEAPIVKILDTVN